MRSAIVIIAAGIVLSGCGSFNNAIVHKHKTVEYYRIFDIKTNADRSTVAEAASNGLGRNVRSANEATPIPNFSEPPEKPGRFKIVSPLAGTRFEQMAAMGGGSGLGLKTASCDGAVWTARADRTIEGDSQLLLSICLWQYKEGYHLDAYATFSKTEGGVMQISRSLASAMVGTSEEWTEKTFLDIVRSIHKATGAEITYLEGYPKLSGTPWLDPLDKM